MKRAALAAALLCLAGAGAAPAAAIRLDDSLSPRQRIDAQPQWEFNEDRDLSDDELNALVAVVPAFEVRLRTAPHLGRNASIYLALSRQTKSLRLPTAVRLEWTTRGRFIAGKVLPGDRALVFRGRIDAPVITEILDLRLHIDGRYLERGLELEPHFEIELDP